MNRSEKNTGIEIKAQKVTVITPRTKVHGLSLLVLFLFFQSGLYGAFYSFASAFPLDYHDNVLFWGMFLLGLVLWALYYSGRILLLIVPIGLAGIGFFCALNFSLLKNQVGLIINILRNAVNNYFVTELMPYETDPALGTDVTELLILAVLLTGIVLFWGLVIMRNRMLTVLVTLWPSACAMMVGIVPSFWSMSLLILCLIGAFTTGRVDFFIHNRGFLSPKFYKNAVTGYSALVMGTAAAVLLGLSYLFISPLQNQIEGETLKLRREIQSNKIMETVKEAFPKLRLSISGAGQIDSGELGGDIYFTGEEALAITTGKALEETLYVKGYNGRDYTGKRWNQDNDQDFFEAAGDLGLGDQGNRDYFQEAPYRLAYLLESEQGVGGLEGQLKINRKAASSDRLYVPYISHRTAQTREDEYAYSFYSRKAYSELLASGGSLSIVNEGEEAYRNYAYETYLTYPEEGLPLLEELCRTNPKDNIEDIIEFVSETVKGSAEYTLEPGMTPVDKDFVEYFMFENHKGYCVHFATSAVMMFRMYGVPARYAAGYVAPENEFHLNNDGLYEAHIKDDKAHAWAEIYIDGEGWIPVEATPGYTSGRGRNLTQRDQNDTTAMTDKKQPESIKSSEKEGNQQTEKNSAAGTGNAFINSTPGRILLIVLAAGAVCLAAGVTLRIRRKLILKKRFCAGIRDIFVGMFDAMILGGMPKYLDGTEKDFSGKAVQYFPGILKKDFDRVMELVMRANYGDGKFTEEDKDWMRKMYVIVCREVYQKLSIAERFEFKYLRVLF